MYVYIPALSEREARNYLASWNYDRTAPIVDILHWAWFTVYVFDVGQAGLTH